LIDASPFDADRGCRPFGAAFPGIGHARY
jgi:hypothetical protein